MGIYILYITSFHLGIMIRFKTVVNKKNMHHINMLRGLQNIYIKKLFMFNKLCIYIGLRKSPFMLNNKPVSYLMHAFFKVFNMSTTLLKHVLHTVYCLLFAL